jgi:hypothetical protein
MNEQAKPIPKADLAMLAARQQLMAKQFEEEMYCDPMRERAKVPEGGLAKYLSPLTWFSRDREGKNICIVLDRDWMKMLGEYAPQQFPHAKEHAAAKHVNFFFASAKMQHGGGGAGRPYPYWLTYAIADDTVVYPKPSIKMTIEMGALKSEINAAFARRTNSQFADIEGLVDPKIAESVLGVSIGVDLASPTGRDVSVAAIYDNSHSREYMEVLHEQGKKQVEDLLRVIKEKAEKALKGYIGQPLTPAVAQSMRDSLTTVFQSTPHTVPNPFANMHLSEEEKAIRKAAKHAEFAKNYGKAGKMTNPCCEVDSVESHVVSVPGSFESHMLDYLRSGVSVLEFDKLTKQEREELLRNGFSQQIPPEKPTTDPLVDWLYKDQLAAARRLGEPVKMKAVAKEEDMRTNRDRLADDRRKSFARDIRRELYHMDSMMRMIEHYFKMASKHGMDLPELEHVKGFVKSFRETIKKEDRVK